jgi:hypothetical protein
VITLRFEVVVAAAVFRTVVAQAFWTQVLEKLPKWRSYSGLG